MRTCPNCSEVLKPAEGHEYPEHEGGGYFCEKNDDLAMVEGESLTITFLTTVTDASVWERLLFTVTGKVKSKFTFSVKKICVVEGVPSVRIRCSGANASIERA